MCRCPLIHFYDTSTETGNSSSCTLHLRWGTDYLTHETIDMLEQGIFFFLNLFLQWQIMLCSPSEDPPAGAAHLLVWLCFLPCPDEAPCAVLTHALRLLTAGGKQVSEWDPLGVPLRMDLKAPLLKAPLPLRHPCLTPNGCAEPPYVSQEKANSGPSRAFQVSHPMNPNPRLGFTPWHMLNPREEQPISISLSETQMC